MFDFALVTLAAAGIVFFLGSRGNAIRTQIAPLRAGGEIDLAALRLGIGFDALFLRVVAALFLLAFAGRVYLSRFARVLDHGFMTGVDYVDQNFRIPLQWLFIGVCVVSAVFAFRGRWKILWLLPAVRLIETVVPLGVHALYVRPNEINIQRPYIVNHIEATRSAFGLSGKLKEREYAAKLDTRIEPARHQAQLDNVRLWDWQAFHDTVTQIQALRPYYVFNDSDVDRYMIDGKLRQVMLTPRVLDIEQLPDARTRWINPHLSHPRLRGRDGRSELSPPMDFAPAWSRRAAGTQTASLRLTRPGDFTTRECTSRSSCAPAKRSSAIPRANDSVHAHEGTGGFPSIPSLRSRRQATPTSTSRSQRLYHDSLP